MANFNIRPNSYVLHDAENRPLAFAVNIHNGTWRVGPGVLGSDKLSSQDLDLTDVLIDVGFLEQPEATLQAILFDIAQRLQIFERQQQELHDEWIGHLQSLPTRLQEEQVYLDPKSPYYDGDPDPSEEHSDRAAQNQEMEETFDRLQGLDKDREGPPVMVADGWHEASADPPSE